MKNFKKGFTLVEMLIVVVIIGILAAALLPRLGSAQSSARDSARKSDLSQLGTTFIAYLNNRGYYPDCNGEKATQNDAISVCEADGTDSKVAQTLKDVTDLTSMPQDPNKGNTFDLYNDQTKVPITDGKYGYIVMKKNSIDRNGLVLVARTETEGGSNWLMTDTKGLFTKDDATNGNYKDVSKVKPCLRFEKVAAWQEALSDDKGVCKYSDKSQLRYIYLF